MNDLNENELHAASQAKTTSSLASVSRVDMSFSSSFFFLSLASCCFPFCRRRRRCSSFSLKVKSGVFALHARRRLRRFSCWLTRKPSKTSDVDGLLVVVVIVGDNCVFQCERTRVSFLLFGLYFSIRESEREDSIDRRILGELFFPFAVVVYARACCYSDLGKDKQTPTNYEQIYHGWRSK